MHAQRNHRRYRLLPQDRVLRFPRVGQLANLGRNTLRMPVFRDLYFSVFKNQNLWGEKLKAQFPAEMFKF
jgi:hypothetical protein